MKKLTTLFALLMLCIGQMFADNFEVGGVYYYVESDEEVYVTRGSYSGDMTIPATVTYNGVTYKVTRIDNGAFSNCWELTSINIPNGVTSIENDAFRNCSSLISITIPDGVTSIEEDTFNGCSSLSSITIPNSVKSIGDHAFSHCSELTSITIPNGVTSIEGDTFSDCHSLSSITIPDGVESIGGGAFYDCYSLSSITIPNSVTSIGDYAFACSGLTSVTIPSSVTSIGESAFEECYEIRDVYNYATTPQTISDNVFTTYEDATLHVAKNCEAAYRNADVWKKFYSIKEDIVVKADFTDGKEYNSTEQKEYDELSYSRIFSSNNWQALYVPFSMTYDDWKDYMDVYDIYNVLAYDEDNDGVIERTTVNMIRLKEGAVTEPNYPYVMRAKNTGAVEITLTDAALYPAEENSIYCCSTKQRFTFTGNYKVMTGLYTKGYYALDGGILKTATNDEVELKPQRWYMEVSNQDGSPITAATRIFLNAFGEEDEVEGVKGVAVNIIGEETTYDLNGRTVNTIGLPKGLYVRGGKKIIVK